ncbi:sodium/potassium-transporting ATPase subunit beta-2-like [Lycorma delicatula]|uniref:sodium/potassium-transporting ATPase subunit beta-2-like n=1 Tax=Lycorma delicatula TaxID=130591 RepID=UPI003F50D6F0
MKWVTVTILLGLLFTAVTSNDHLPIKLLWQPKPEDPKNSFIWFNRTSYEYWSNSLDNYLEAYRTPSLTPGRLEKLVKCNYTNPPEGKNVCHINVDSYTPCISTNYFGYKKLTPCVFLEINKVLNWKPSYYSDMSELPSSMPPFLKTYIDEKTVHPSGWNTVWISCDGETPTDQEFIGPLQYIPEPGIPAYFLPYDGREGYLSPVVAIHFKQPQIGVIINVECKIWAPNIIHNREKSTGIAKFQLLID